VSERRPGLTSVVVVAADSGPLLRACVDSVLASDAAELVLVDNASGDGVVEQIAAERHSESRLAILRNATNIGFGPACNRGAAHTSGDVLVFLNPDAALRADTLPAVRAAFASDPVVAVIGVNVCAPEGVPARGNRRREPTLRRALMTVSGLARLERRFPSLAGIEMPAPQATPDRRSLEFVEAISGACIAVRAEAFVKIGGFDEAYFLHAEDLDLCRRMRDAGYAVAFAAGVCITHTQGSSSRSRPLFVARHKHRGMWRYFVKFDPAARNPLARAVVYAGIWTHFSFAVAAHAVKRALRASS
jgi:GT2 family glycosyltransferase